VAPGNRLNTNLFRMSPFLLHDGLFLKGTQRRQALAPRTPSTVQGIPPLPFFSRLRPVRLRFDPRSPGSRSPSSGIAFSRFFVTKTEGTRVFLPNFNLRSRLRRFTISSSVASFTDPKVISCLPCMKVFIPRYCFHRDAPLPSSVPKVPHRPLNPESCPHA